MVGEGNGEQLWALKPRQGTLEKEAATACAKDA